MASFFDTPIKDLEEWKSGDSLTKEHLNEPVHAINRMNSHAAAPPIQIIHGLQQRSAIVRSGAVADKSVVVVATEDADHLPQIVVREVGPTFDGNGVPINGTLDFIGSAFPVFPEPPWSIDAFSPYIRPQVGLPIDAFTPMLTVVTRGLHQYVLWPKVKHIRVKFKSINGDFPGVLFCEDATVPPVSLLVATPEAFRGETQHGTTSFLNTWNTQSRIATPASSETENHKVTKEWIDGDIVDAIGPTTTGVWLGNLHVVWLAVDNRSWAEVQS